MGLGPEPPEPSEEEAARLQHDLDLAKEHEMELAEQAADLEAQRIDSILGPDELLADIHVDN